MSTRQPSYVWVHAENGVPVRTPIVDQETSDLVLTPLGHGHYRIASSQTTDALSPRDGHALVIDNQVWVAYAGKTYLFEKDRAKRRLSGDAHVDREVTAPMPGKVRDVFVTVGQRVEKGDVLVILEAMKMEHRLLAPVSGEVKVCSVAVGDLVQAGKELVEIA